MNRQTRLKDITSSLHRGMHMVGNNLCRVTKLSEKEEFEDSFHSGVVIWNSFMAKECVHTHTLMMKHCKYVQQQKNDD